MTPIHSATVTYRIVFGPEALATSLVLLLIGSSGYTQQIHTPRIPPFVYRTWMIYKFVEVGGHAIEKRERAQRQVGKSLKIGARSFNHDNDLRWFGSVPCKSAKYRMKVNENAQDDAEKGSLGFYEWEPAQSDLDPFVILSCDQRDLDSLS